MATVSVGIDSDLDPSAAWALAANLSRFDEWMTIFGGWKSPVPATIDEGTKVSSLIKVKGFRNVIHWTVTQYDEPRLIALAGTGRGGIQIDLAMKVDEIADGSYFDLSAEVSGGLLNGPVGSLVARVLESDVHKSISNLATLR
ncbi:SRPBCC family protein [Gordonia amicalis]|uniref:SRPBCC family protein n=1 Tax=Gordonia amicalis TaxID=89053 RepID=A0AAE4U7P0_9ACTN|nr:SRPBCC family protein [Gordonia amicalis]MCZ4577739.1 SRPBCC family protein [Gordonia amicalis]MDV6310563.1 SRPBCC family protein [Gordonia amicalis]MDV7098710.1 SRPBCC family protein [Gordonia amicalis]MDV7172198.1 SRPBCC family protein [Gordonia amicalis]NKX78920.1 SRPBCC family protein [Gordonia amicalis]